MTDETTTETIADWHESLPDDIRENPSLSDVKDVAGLAQRFIDTKAMVGNSVRPPTDDASQEDIDSFVDKMLENSHIPLMRKIDVDNAESMSAIYKSLGVPEDAAGYELADGFDAGAFGELAAYAHEHNVPKKQLEGMASEIMRLNNASIEKSMEPHNQEMERLKGEWGQAYDEKVSRIQQFIKANKSELDFAGGVENNQVGADWLRLFDGIVTQFGGEGTEIAKQMTASSHITPGEIEQRRNEVTQRLMNDTLSQRERAALQEKLIKYSQDLIDSRAA